MGIRRPAGTPISFSNAGGLEQPLWDPGLNRFWLTVPGIGSGVPPLGSPPRIVRIDSTTGLVDKTITLDCQALGGSGSGITGMRLTDRLPYFLSGVGLPDCLILGAETLTKGTEGVRGAGFFGNDWSVTKGEFLWRKE